MEGCSGMADRDLVYRQLSQADGQRINELFASAYGRSRPLSQWSWEYGQGLFGEPVLWGVESEGQLIGHYALLPFQLNYRGQTISSAKAESAMVDPRYRGRGICLNLVKLTLKDAAEKGIQVIWGFPNEQSFGIMQKSGRRCIGGLHGFVRLLRPARVLGAFAARKMRGWFGRSSTDVDEGAGLIHWPLPGFAERFAGEGSVAAMEGFDERFDHLWEEAQRDLGLSIARSGDYLNWRFIRNPHGRYVILAAMADDGRLEGYMVSTLKVEFGLHIGYVADFLIRKNNGPAFRRLLSATLDVLQSNGADMVTLFLNRDHRSARIFLPVLAQLRFRERKHPKRFAVKIFAEELAEAGYSGENWYLTGAFAEGVEF